jgi:hypothetical protein
LTGRAFLVAHFETAPKPGMQEGQSSLFPRASPLNTIPITYTNPLTGILAAIKPPESGPRLVQGQSLRISFRVLAVEDPNLSGAVGAGEEQHVLIVQTPPTHSPYLTTVTIDGQTCGS